MGFWKSLFGLEKNNKEKSGKELSINTQFVTIDEEQEFENSIYGALQLYNSEIDFIVEMVPEKAEPLKKQIRILIELLEKTNDESDPEVRRLFLEFERQYKEVYKLADGEFTIKELEKQNRMMDKTFEKSYQENDGISKKMLYEYLDYITKIQNKVSEREKNGNPIFNGVQRQRFNSVSIRSEYRIKMLELMYLLNSNPYGVIEENPFKALSPLKQKMFSQFFLEDAKNATSQYSELSEYEELFKKYGYSYSEIDDMAKNLNDKITDIQMVSDFSISQLFDSENPSLESFEVLKDFVKFKRKLNYMRFAKPQLLEMQKKEMEEVQKKAEEEARVEEEKIAQKKKEEEELQAIKTMSDFDISATIYGIEHDLTAKGSRYVNILDFQKKIAREKGLLDSEFGLQNDKVIYKTADASETWQIIQNANKSGVNYMVFPDCQENSNGGFMIAISESDRKNLDIRTENIAWRSEEYNYSYDIELGKYPSFILRKLYEKLDYGNARYYYLHARKINNSFLYNLRFGGGRYGNFMPHSSEYEMTKLDVDKKLKEIYNELKEYGGTAEELKDVLCYLSVPASRNIIPILQSFKDSDITAYIEPVPEKGRNEDNRDNIHIYFERKDLDKFRKEVYPNVSNSKVGIASLKWDNKNFGQALIEECEWSKDLELETEDR